MAETENLPQTSDTSDEWALVENEPDGTEFIRIESQAPLELHQQKYKKRIITCIGNLVYPYAKRKLIESIPRVIAYGALYAGGLTGTTLAMVVQSML